MSSLLDETRIERYARQIVLPEIGGKGQERLLRARVLVIGAGGLGCPLAAYLAGAGVGELGIVDDDRVDASNLHRQIFYTQDDIGRPKARCLKARLQALNPDCAVKAHEVRLNAENAQDLLAAYDVIADGSDNLATRRVVHDVAMHLGLPLVSAAVQGMDGQITTYRAFDGPPHPCHYCHNEVSACEDLLPSCAQGGVLGAAAGVVGSLQAVEVVRAILRADGPGDDLSGKLLMYDAAAQDFFSLQLKRRADCSFCGELMKS